MSVSQLFTNFDQNDKKTSDKNTFSIAHHCT